MGTKCINYVVQPLSAILPVCNHNILCSKVHSNVCVRLCIHDVLCCRRVIMWNSNELRLLDLELTLFCFRK